MRWIDAAKAAIMRVHQTLPENVTPAERKKAIDAAYPFGERARWPYKAWLKERRQYLARYGAVKPKDTLSLFDEVTR